MQAHLAALHRELTETREALAAREAPVTVAPALDGAKRQLFRSMEPTLLQLPVVRHALTQGAPTTASDVLALLEPLEQALVNWGYERIGHVGTVVPFSSDLHIAAAGPLAHGEPALVRTPGYRLDDQVMVRARVVPG
jgi:hypothetical protein